jgi:L-alanine-DL-glutamate epimerase-like enolase superfamily enzyme
MNRRTFLAASAGAAVSAAAAERAPVFPLRRFFDAPVKIASIELLHARNRYFLRTRSTGGVEGVIQTKNIEDFIPILLRRVAPRFLGKDARDLENLVDEVYVANYKMAGQALWCPVAYVEQSLLDLLGKTARKPVAELMGGVLRKEIPVYLSGSGRETTAEEEVGMYVREQQRTGAKAVKFKIGGRMSANRDAYPGRTDKLLELAHKRFEGKAALMADANGSYSAGAAIGIGRRLEQMKCLWFEEPCPWDERSETRKVAEALSIRIAAGEQDSSLWLFEWMISNGVMDIVQPDLNYNGGFIRTARVARAAQRANLWIVPHNTQTGAASVNILHFAASTPNAGPYMEYVSRAPRPKESWYTPDFDVVNGVIPVPAGPGFGVAFDPEFLKKAAVITE